MSFALQWVTSTGDAWARRWLEVDRALSGLGAKLHPVLLEMAPPDPFRALDVGCGAGTTSLALAGDRPDATIIACDLSPALARLARVRASGAATIHVRRGDVQDVAVSEGPFDLIVSRHGVMFFNDPIAVFEKLRTSAKLGAGLVFSCFQSWEANPWACEVASAAAGRSLPPPGREPSGFAFAESNYVRGILEASGWIDGKVSAVRFPYLIGEGAGAVGQALSFLEEIGPAARVLDSLSEQERDGAIARMRDVLESYFNESAVEIPAAAWIWSARAGGAAL